MEKDKRLYCAVLLDRTSTETLARLVDDINWFIEEEGHLHSLYTEGEINKMHKNIKLITNELEKRWSNGENIEEIQGRIKNDY